MHLDNILLILFHLKLIMYIELVIITLGYNLLLKFLRIKLHYKIE